MGADERFRQAKLQRERNQFDGQLAQSIKNGDERALPSDKFGLTIRPGVVVFHFSSEPTPPVCTVTDVQPVLDPRAPAGMIRVRLVHDVFVPAGVPNPHFLVVGDAPTEEPSNQEPKQEVDPTRVNEEPSAEPSGPKLVLTDAH